MTCAKEIVHATLTCADGKVYHGRNDCASPVQVCPRLPGEDYTKCRSICHQPHHAEIAAVFACVESGGNPMFADISVSKTPCSRCQIQLAIYGIDWKVETCPAPVSSPTVAAAASTSPAATTGDAPIASATGPIQP